ncbi:hypothetical protein BDZ97DRAFT_1873190 [Flammula alnicola]|nr:hypothetical protein BDZ97DRAFT_1873190 [Flammula alnicola]
MPHRASFTSLLFPCFTPITYAPRPHHNTSQSHPRLDPLTTCCILALFTPMLTERHNTCPPHGLIPIIYKHQ